MNPNHDKPEDREFQLSRYLDGDLPDEDRALLESELKRDPALRETLEQMRRVDQLTRDWGQQVPSVNTEAFVTQVRRQRETFDGSRRVVRIYRLFAPMAAAAVIALLIGGYLLVQMRAPARPEGGTPFASVTVGPAATPPAAPGEAAASVSFSQGTTTFAALHTEKRTTLLVVAGVEWSDSSDTQKEEAPYF